MLAEVPLCDQRGNVELERVQIGCEPLFSAFAGCRLGSIFRAGLLG